MAMVRRFGPLKPRLEGNNRHIGILIKYLEVSISIFAVTPRKINMEPANTPLASFSGAMLIFGGVVDPFWASSCMACNCIPRDQQLSSKWFTSRKYEDMLRRNVCKSWKNHLPIVKFCLSLPSLRSSRQGCPSEVLALPRQRPHWPGRCWFRQLEGDSPLDVTKAIKNDMKMGWKMDLRMIIKGWGHMRMHVMHANHLESN